MRRVLRTFWTVLREVAFALSAQPSRPGASPAERANKAAQTERLRQAPEATLLDAARQVGAEGAKAALGQPTPAARRRS